jgi:hypothetical protein
MQIMFLKPSPPLLFEQTMRLVMTIKPTAKKTAPKTGGTFR